MSRSSVIRFLIAGSCAGALALTVPAVSQASVRPRAASYVYGIDTYVTYDCVSQSQIDGWARTEALQFKALGANTIGIGFPIYTPSINSNEIYGKLVCGNQQYQTPPASIVGSIVKVDESVGLKVLLRPLLDQTNLYEENKNYWRGVIAPTNMNTWMQNYLTTLRPYLQMAQQDKVSYFALETELDSITHAPNWNTAVTLTKAIYKGTLVWNYSWLSAVSKVTLKGTTFAVDAYPQLKQLSINATPAQITAGWNSVLRTAGYHLPNASATTLDEVGISAQDGAYANPSNTSYPLSTHPFNQNIQVNWFTGACAFMKHWHMKGLFFWGPFLTTNNGKMLSSPDPNAASNIQPLSQKAIKKCF